MGDLRCSTGIRRRQGSSDRSCLVLSVRIAMDDMDREIIELADRDFRDSQWVELVNTIQPVVSPHYGEKRNGEVSSTPRLLTPLLRLAIVAFYLEQRQRYDPAQVCVPCDPGCQRVRAALPRAR